MEQLENMEEIEALQTELGQFLADMIPVPWKKIRFFGSAASGTSTAWVALEEAETDAVCTCGTFWNRYDSYKYSERDTMKKLMNMVSDLYKTYVAKEGEDKVWKAMYYTLESDGAVHIDFEFDYPADNWFEGQRIVYKRFFNAEFKQYKTKYPSKERR